MELSSLLSRFNEPETLKMAKLGRELRAKGIDVTDLSLGEPDFDTPQHIKEAAKLPLNYLDLSMDQMLFINEFYFASSQKVDLKKMKKALADAAINADLIYIAMNDLDDLLKDAE